MQQKSGYCRTSNVRNRLGINKKSPQWGVLVLRTSLVTDILLVVTRKIPPTPPQPFCVLAKHASGRFV